jgi:hypothetical protein
VPSNPDGVRLDFGSPDFLKLEQGGMAAVGHAAFVLVAGGLGERLGYKGRGGNGVNCAACAQNSPLNLDILTACAHICQHSVHGSSVPRSLCAGCWELGERLGYKGRGCGCVHHVGMRKLAVKHMHVSRHRGAAVGHAALGWLLGAWGSAWVTMVRVVVLDVS